MGGFITKRRSFQATLLHKKKTLHLILLCLQYNIYAYVHSEKRGFVFRTEEITVFTEKEAMLKIV